MPIDGRTKRGKIAKAKRMELELEGSVQVSEQPVSEPVSNEQLSEIIKFDDVLNKIPTKTLVHHLQNKVDDQVAKSFIDEVQRHLLTYPNTVLGNVIRPWLPRSLMDVNELSKREPVVSLAITVLRSELFRQGIQIRKKFWGKCDSKKCDMEYEEKPPDLNSLSEKEFAKKGIPCEECENGIIWPPDKKQRIELRENIKQVNYNKESLKDVAQQCEDDINRYDNMYMAFFKNYEYNEKDKLVSTLREIVRLDPIVMLVSADERGLIGKKAVTCLFHRNFIIEKNEDNDQYYIIEDQNRKKFNNEQIQSINTNTPINKLECPICGDDRLYPVWYVATRDGSLATFEQAFIENEVKYKNRYHPSPYYGFSPILVAWQYATSLIDMTKYIYDYFRNQQIPRGMLAVPGTSESVKIAKTTTVNEMKKNKHAIPWFAIPMNADGKAMAMPAFIAFTNTLDELQYTAVRDEFRLRITALYGVSPFFQNDTTQGSGLNSVLGCTPIIVRKYKKWVDILPIACLHTDYDHTRSNYGLLKYEALSRSGWTPIKYSFRQKNKKKIFDINTYDGFTQVTEDHSLFMLNEEIKGENIRINNNIDRIKPEIIYNKIDNITEELAWALGFFAADGSSAAVKRNANKDSKKYGTAQGWSVTFHQVYKEPLLKCKEGIDGFFGVDSKLRLGKNSNGNDIYTLEASHKHIYEWLDQYCYSTYIEKNIKEGEVEIINHREKKVPIQVLNGSSKIKKSFIDGYWEGDGSKTEDTKRCSGIYKSLMAGIQYLLNQIGFYTSISWRPNGKNRIIRLGWLKGESRNLPNKVKSINSYDFYGDLYDIETEDHSFVAGLGYLLHHNSEDLQLTLTNQAIERNQGTWNTVEDQYGIFEDITRAYGITDWELYFPPPMEADQVAPLERKLKKIIIAESMQRLNYEAELPEEGLTDETDFYYTKREFDPNMGAFGGNAGIFPNNQNQGNVGGNGNIPDESLNEDGSLDDEIKHNHSHPSSSGSESAHGHEHTHASGTNPDDHNHKHNEEDAGQTEDSDRKRGQPPRGETDHQDKKSKSISKAQKEFEKILMKIDPVDKLSSELFSQLSNFYRQLILVMIGDKFANRDPASIGQDELVNAITEMMVIAEQGTEQFGIDFAHASFNLGVLMVESNDESNIPNLTINSLLGIGSENDTAALRAYEQSQSYKDAFSGFSMSVSDQFREIVRDSFTTDKKTIDQLVVAMQNIVPAEADKLFRIARTEVTRFSNEGRVLAYKKVEEDQEAEFKYIWFVNHDDRLSEICETIERRVPIEGVSIDELYRIVIQAQHDLMGSKWQASWLIHPNCRSRPLRKI